MLNLSLVAHLLFNFRYEIVLGLHYIGFLLAASVPTSIVCDNSDKNRRIRTKNMHMSQQYTHYYLIRTYEGQFFLS